MCMSRHEMMLPLPETTVSLPDDPGTHVVWYWSQDSFSFDVAASAVMSEGRARLHMFLTRPCGCQKPHHTASGSSQQFDGSNTPLYPFRDGSKLECLVERLSLHVIKVAVRDLIGLGPIFLHKHVSSGCPPLSRAGRERADAGR
ncbi:hypothetical protein HII31_11307 [Pseudocercospora fuligena]|uniref:Uncharacterized protein n=1 Tax=Pseudocercospora fuligena TaxID=685502 RepID=A0A8H6RAF7_9PEZI|nr:hypothetical protein HII31_11307 [Pseudocercospora fuligena]